MSPDHLFRWHILYTDFLWLKNREYISRRDFLNLQIYQPSRQARLIYEDLESRDVIYIPCFGSKENQFLYFIATGIAFNFFGVGLTTLIQQNSSNFYRNIYCYTKRKRNLIIVIKKSNEKRRNCKNFKRVANHPKAPINPIITQS